MIAKHFSDRLEPERFTENNIDLKITKILDLQQSRMAKTSRNLKKFMMIVECPSEIEELTKSLGKMLRLAWSR